MLRNAMGVGVSDFQEKGLQIQEDGSTLLALRGGGWVSNLPGKCVT